MNNDHIPPIFFGSIWLAAAGFVYVSRQYLFVGAFGVLGVVWLICAYLLWPKKKQKGD